MKKSFGVVKKRKTENEIVDFKKFKIEELLLEKDLEFRNPNKAPGGWLPLEAFDDKDMDTRAPKDWMIVKRDKPASNNQKSHAGGSDVQSDISHPKIIKTEIPA